MNIQIRKILELNNKNFEIMLNWLYKWWGFEEHYSKEGLKCWLKCCFQSDKLPMTYGLFEDDRIIGMYQFVNEDLFYRPDIYPWLANVYIEEESRKKGYFNLMMNSIKNNFPKDSKYKEIYLYTIYEGLYEKHGWEYVGEIDIFQKKNRIQRLYKLNLTK